MPQSDDLYSAEDLDNESFSDELSPADGYFSRGEVSASPMVLDPTVEDTKPEAKTLIPPNLVGSMARGSRISTQSSSLPSHSYASAQSTSHSLPSHTSNTPTSPISSRRLDDLFPRRPASMNGPPPAYSPAPETTPSVTQPPSSTSYNTFPEQHLEQESFPRRDEPQSMGNPEEPPSETTPLARNHRKRSPCRTIFRKLILVALVLTVTITLLTSLFRGLNSDSSFRPLPDMPDSGMPYCSSATHKNNITTYEVPQDASLSIVQTTYDGDNDYRTTRVETAGQIRLRRQPKGSKRGELPYITVDVHVSDLSLNVIKTWDRETNVLEVMTPNYALLDSGIRPCVSLEITAWFPENAEFSDLLIQAVHLSLKVFEDIRISVTGQSKFRTITGNVLFPASDPKQDRAITPFSSRRILVETTSGTITGDYPLMDYLGLKTVSGDIKASVEPKKVLPSAPAPAELEVQTASSLIEVTLPVKNAVNSAYTPPARDYITRVHSSSGDIKGSFYIGSISRFISGSGSVHITGLPILQAKTSSPYEASFLNKFETNSVSGSIQVDVLDPIFITLVPFINDRPENPSPKQPYLPIGDDDPYLILPPPSMDKAPVRLDNSVELKKTMLRNLRSSHESKSSDVSIHYPQAWEGTVLEKTFSGSVSADGDGLEIIHHKKGYASNEILARKGVDSDDEGSYVEINAISGSLSFLVG